MGYLAAQGAILAIGIVIGIAVFFLLLWLQRTSVGSWVIGGLHLHARDN